MNEYHELNENPQISSGERIEIPFHEVEDTSKIEIPDDVSELSADNVSMNTQEIRNDAAETVAPMIRRYAELHQKISELTAQARGYRVELKELEGKITNYMRQNEIGNFNLGNEKSLELRQSFRRIPLSKKNISAAVANFPENISTQLFSALFVERQAEEKFSLKMK